MQLKELRVADGTNTHIQKTLNFRTHNRSRLMSLIEGESPPTELLASARIESQLNDGITKSSAVRDQSYCFLLFQT
jgi:hypothetical protein